MSTIKKVIILTSFFLILCSCSSTPERVDGTPFKESQYRRDDMNCLSQVKKSHPYLSSQVQTGEMPNSQLLSMGASEYNNCMTDKGWKKF